METETPTLRDLLTARIRFLALMALLFTLIGWFGEWIGFGLYVWEYDTGTVTR